MEWKEYRMEDIIDEISMGPFGSDVRKECYVSNGIPILNGSNLQGFKLNEDAFGYLTEEKADSLRKSNAHRGDIIVTHRGTLGQIIYIPKDSKYERYVISQSQFRFRIKKDLADVKYLVYFFHTPLGQHKILANASQVGVPALARATTTFRQIEINLPPLSTQRRIASILSSLDAKIETNNKINAQLEEMAQAIFKNWFVDFEPFKDGKFVESELGLIPEGWKVGKLGDVLVNIESGKRQKGGAVIDGVPSIGAEKIENICYYDFSSEKYISEDFFNRMTQGVIKNRDVLLYKDGAYAGKTTMFMNGFPYLKCAVNEHVFILRTEDSLWQSWLYLLLSYPQIKEYIHTLAASKAAQPGLNQTELKSVEIIIPCKDVLQSFEKRVTPLLEAIICHLKGNKHLTQLRDTLLPKLMNGEIEI